MRNKNGFKLLPGKSGWFSLTEQVGSLAVYGFNIFWIVCGHHFVFIDIEQLRNTIVVPCYKPPNLWIVCVGKYDSGGMIVVPEYRENGEIVLVAEHRRIQLAGVESAPDHNGTIAPIEKILCVNRHRF